MSLAFLSSLMCVLVCLIQLTTSRHIDLELKRQPEHVNNVNEKSSSMITNQNEHPMDTSKKPIVPTEALESVNDKLKAPNTKWGSVNFKSKIISTKVSKSAVNLLPDPSLISKTNKQSFKSLWSLIGKKMQKSVNTWSDPTHQPGNQRPQETFGVVLDQQIANPSIQPPRNMDASIGKKIRRPKVDPISSLVGEPLVSFASSISAPETHDHAPPPGIVFGAGFLPAMNSSATNTNPGTFDTGYALGELPFSVHASDALLSPNEAPSPQQLIGSSNIAPQGVAPIFGEPLSSWNTEAGTGSSSDAGEKLETTTQQTTKMTPSSVQDQALLWFWPEGHNTGPLLEKNKGLP